MKPLCVLFQRVTQEYIPKIITQELGWGIKESIFSEEMLMRFTNDTLVYLCFAKVKPNQLLQL